MQGFLTFFLLFLLSGCLSERVPLQDSSETIRFTSTSGLTSTNWTAVDEPGPSELEGNASERFVAYHNGTLLFWEQRREGNNWTGLSYGDYNREFRASPDWSQFWVNATWDDPSHATWRVCAQLYFDEGENLTQFSPGMYGYRHRYCSEPGDGEATLALHEQAIAHVPVRCDLWFLLMESPTPREESVAIQLQWNTTILYGGDAAITARAQESAGQ